MPWEKSRESLEGGAGIIWGWGGLRFHVTEMTAKFKWMIDARTQYVGKRAKQAVESGLKSEKNK